jgi:hypothetical protein
MARMQRFEMNAVRKPRYPSSERCTRGNSLEIRAIRAIRGFSFLDSGSSPGCGGAAFDPGVGWRETLRLHAALAWVSPCQFQENDELDGVGKPIETREERARNTWQVRTSRYFPAP